MNSDHVWTLFREGGEQDGSKLGGYWVQTCKKSESFHGFSEISGKVRDARQTKFWKDKMICIITEEITRNQADLEHSEASAEVFPQSSCKTVFI